MFMLIIYRLLLPSLTPLSEIKNDDVLENSTNTYSSKVYYRCQINVNPQDLYTALFYIRFELKINALAT